MFIQVIQVLNWKSICSRKNSENTSDILTNTFWILLQESQDFLNVLQFLVLPQNLIDLSVAFPAPLRPTSFYTNISKNTFLIIMGWGIKRCSLTTSLNQDKKTCLTVGINIWRKNKSSPWELIQMREYLWLDISSW